MKICKPDYYPQFRCIAGNCPDSCCHEWEVDVDPDSAKAYLSMPGPLGDRLRQVLRQEGGNFVMTITDSRCPMWRQDGLCRIQAELGHDALCKTCREFPRLTHDYGPFTEQMLELSCPVAAELILSATEDRILTEEVPGQSPGDYDEEAMALLLESRQEILSFLNGREYSLPQTLAILLLYAHGVQSQLDGGEKVPFDPELCLQKAHSFAQGGDWKAVFAFFRELEILTDRWLQRLETVPDAPACPESLYGLTFYFIRRYWLQAVSDYDLIGRVKFMVIAILLISALGGDPVSTAQLFSKEIENNPDNVEAILDGAYTAPAFTDRALLDLACKMASLN